MQTSSSQSPVIAEGLSKRYVKGLRSRTRLVERRETAESERGQEFWALKDVSFEVPAGSIAGFIGPNGAGKSTLLKILARITPPTKGSATLVGDVASLIEVGTGFHPELTGRENIYLSAAIHGMSRQVTLNRLDDIVEFAGIGSFVDTPVKRYSSGMYVRLGFSVAAHVEPDILIVDEILAVGDAAFQVQCLDRVAELKNAGTSILWVTHDLDQVQQLCDSVCLLDGGELRATGPPVDVVAQYREAEGVAAGTLEGVERSSRGSGDVRITDVESIYQSTGERALTGEPFGIDVDVTTTSSTQLDDLNVGIWIHDANGRLLVGTNTQLLKCSFPSLARGHVRVSFRFGYAPLTSGTYLVSAAVEGADGYRYDQIVKAANLHVVDSGSTIGHVGFTPSASVEIVEPKE